VLTGDRDAFIFENLFAYPLGDWQPSLGFGREPRHPTVVDPPPQLVYEAVARWAAAADAIVYFRASREFFTTRGWLTRIESAVTAGRLPEHQHGFLIGSVTSDAHDYD
jgi:hypothetical protein